ncbi:MAG: beta-galactosidase, partial [Phycisphaerae bacterium]
TPAPGQMRLWAYQSIAHGADGMLHFRWRTCPYGAEEYWNGILDHDNIPRRRYEEFAREGRELKTIGEKILGTVVDVKAAALLDHDQDNAYKTLAMGLPSPADQRDQAYREMWNRHLPCGLVNANDRFDGLELIVLPSMQMMDEPLAVRLQQFVESGGTLMVTARSATKDRDNQVITQTPPGLIRELCGVTVEEFGKIESGSLSLKLGEQTLRSGGGYEVLQLCGAQEAGRWLAPSDAAPSAATGEPAVAINKVGRGTVIYVGTYLTEQNVSDLLGFALSFTTLTPMVDADQAVEVTRRTDGRRKLLFLLNHYPTPRAVRNVPAGTDLLTDQPVEGELELPAYGVAVVEEE